MVIDYFDIKQAVQPIVDSLDHQHLGSGTVTIGSGSLVFLGPSTELSLPSLPTSENLLLWLGDQLRKTSPDFTWSRLTLNETCTSSAELTFEEWRTFYNATH
jgi:6-pyruvoyl-tetrahydropterin synthase